MTWLITHWSWWVIEKRHNFCPVNVEPLPSFGSDLFRLFPLTAPSSSPYSKLATFRFDYEYEIEYEYDVRISKQTRSQSPRSSLLLSSRGECEVNDIYRTDHNQKLATRNSKVVALLNLVLVVRSEGRYSWVTDGDRKVKVFLLTHFDTNTRL